MKDLWHWTRRYFSIVAACVIMFLAYMLFWQDNSVFRYMEYSRTVDSLQYEIALANDTLERYQLLNRQLSHDPEAMERVVREQYNMVRQGEDVYVFE